VLTTAIVLRVPHHGLGAQAAHAGVHEANAEEQRQPQRRTQLRGCMQRHGCSCSHGNQTLRQATQLLGQVVTVTRQTQNADT
jgi:hypothetical protein